MKPITRDLVHGLSLGAAIWLVAVAALLYATGAWGATPACTMYTRNSQPWSCVGPTGAPLSLGACTWRVGACYGIGLNIVPLCERVYGPPIPSPPVTVLVPCG